jgi:Ni/Co efflux regulator RcnB
MIRGLRIGLAMAALLLAADTAAAEGREHGHGAPPPVRPAPRAPEPHPGAQGYQRVAEPHGWDARPATVDRPAYQHNFQAARSHRIGVYPGLRGWVARRWGYDQILQRSYRTREYILADHWLLGLEVPPAGLEWVRDWDDAIMVNVATGEILQVEYGVFS